MATSIQRLLIITSILSLLLVGINSYYSNDIQNFGDALEDEIDYQRNFSYTYKSDYEETTSDSSNTEYDPIWGDSKFSQQSWYRTLTTSIGITNHCSYNSCIDAEQVMAYVLQAMTGLINILLALEVFFILWSKKNT